MRSLLFFSGNALTPILGAILHGHDRNDFSKRNFLDQQSTNLSVISFPLILDTIFHRHHRKHFFILLSGRNKFLTNLGLYFFLDKSSVRIIQRKMISWMSALIGRNEIKLTNQLRNFKIHSWGLSFLEPLCDFYVTFYVTFFILKWFNYMRVIWSG